MHAFVIILLMGITTFSLGKHIYESVFVLYVFVHNGMLSVRPVIRKSSRTFFLRDKNLI